MYAAIRRYRINAECTDEVIRRIAEDFTPLIRDAEGLIGYYVLDAGDGAFVTITICKDQVGVEESSRKATEWMKQYLASTILAQEEVPSFFIEVDEALNGPLYGEQLGHLLGQDSLRRARELHREQTSKASNGNGSELLSIAEVCEELGMGKSWIYKKIRSGETASVKFGRSIKVKRQDLETYIERHRHHPSAEE